MRKMFGAHIGPVMSSAPAFGMISSVLLSRATFAIASATPECTVPISTSTLSRLISLLALSGAFAGSDSSSTVKYSISRPPSLPPCSCDRELEAVGDRGAERRVRSGIRQHQADLDLALLRARHVQQASAAPRRAAMTNGTARCRIVVFVVHAL